MEQLATLAVPLQTLPLIQSSLDKWLLDNSHHIQPWPCFYSHWPTPQYVTITPDNIPLLIQSYTARDTASLKLAINDLLSQPNIGLHPDSQEYVAPPTGSTH